MDSSFWAGVIDVLLVLGRGALAGAGVPAATSAHPVTRLGTGPGEPCPHHGHSHRLWRALGSKPNSPGGPEGPQQGHAGKMPPRPSVTPAPHGAPTLSTWPSTTLQRFPRSSQEPRVPGSSPVRVRPAPDPAPSHQGHRPGWHAAVPGTTGTHRGGRQRPSEPGLGGEGGGRRFVYIVLLFQTALGCGEGFPGSGRREGWPPSPSHLGLHLPDGEDWPPPPQRDPWDGLGTPERPAGSLRDSPANFLPSIASCPFRLGGRLRKQSEPGNRRRPRGSIPPGSAVLPGPPRARALCSGRTPAAKGSPQVSAKPRAPAGQGCGRSSPSSAWPRDAQLPHPKGPWASQRGA